MSGSAANKQTVGTAGRDDCCPVLVSFNSGGLSSRVGMLETVMKPEPYKRSPARACFRAMLAMILLPLLAPAVHASEPVAGANFRIAGKTSRAIQKYSGATFLTDVFLSTGGGIAARLILHGKPKLKVRSYSFTDALSGKFRLVELQLKKCQWRGVPLPDVKLATTTPLHVRHNCKLLIPVMVSVTGSATEEMISSGLQKPEVTSHLNFLRLDLPGLGEQHLQVLNPKIKLNSGQILIDTDLITAGGAPDTGIKVAISARPVLKNERLILLEGTKVFSKDIVEPDKFSQFAEDLLNPLIDFARLDRTTRAFRLTELHLDDQKVRFAGKLLLAPKPVPATPIATNAQSGKKK